MMHDNGLVHAPGKQPQALRHSSSHPAFPTDPERVQVAPLLPPLSHPWLAAVQQDRYYRVR